MPCTSTKQVFVNRTPIGASCLIHELQLDWRYGAAYFEQQLIGTCGFKLGQLAIPTGVGADPGSRRFNLDKRKTYDPNGVYSRWHGEQAVSIDFTDAATALS